MAHLRYTGPALARTVMVCARDAPGETRDVHDVVEEL
jgi:hypothetical protein